jgi:hypothetical protein
MSDSKSILNQIKLYLWPKDAQKKAAAKKSYKAIGLFVVATTLLVKFGKSVADQIYSQAAVEEAIKASLS